MILLQGALRRVFGDSAVGLRFPVSFRVLYSAERSPGGFALEMEGDALGAGAEGTDVWGQI